MIYLQLFLVFFKIGFFCFGGGYTMIPLIGNELVARGWISGAQFADLVAISEVTPGSVSINTATFVGNTVAGFLGGVAATAGVAMPSFLLIAWVAGYLLRRGRNDWVDRAFSGIRPVITGLIVTAAIVIAQNCLLRPDAPPNSLHAWLAAPLEFINVKGWALFLLLLALLKRFRLHPTWLIVISALLGVAFFYLT